MASTKHDGPTTATAALWGSINRGTMAEPIDLTGFPLDEKGLWQAAELVRRANGLPTPPPIFSPKGFEEAAARHGFATRKALDDCLRYHMPGGWSWEVQEGAPLSGSLRIVVTPHTGVTAARMEEDRPRIAAAWQAARDVLPVGLGVDLVVDDSGLAARAQSATDGDFLDRLKAKVKAKWG